MVFSSVEFIVSFVVLLMVYWALPGRRTRVWLLLGASFAFYSLWNHWLALIVCVSTGLDFLLALRLEASTVPWQRKLLLGISLAANLGLLSYFKYLNFFLDSLFATLHAVGYHGSYQPLQLFVPLGISYYTFEAISYMVEVYRRRIPAERNLADFMLFILFFPHLLAGPIVRAKDFLPQIKRPMRFNWARIHLGVLYFLLGLFKKLAIADRMALIADPVYSDPLGYRSSSAWIALAAYAFQVFCDFSGYTDMAIGTAHMLGYKLTANFNLAYLAPNIGEFWKRWHITLSTWLRDYVYIPLGGSRGSTWQTYRNLMLTFIVCGLWHGPAWTYVVFGFLQGIQIILHRSFHKWCQARVRLDALLQSLPGTVARIAFTFACFCVSLVVFRATDFEHVGQMYYRLLHGAPWAGVLPVPEFGFWMTAAVLLAGHLLGRSGVWIRPALRLPAPTLGFGYAVVLALTLALAPQGDAPFIYFQF
jgi:alginate O-acetyltransferase complex protein AlgI